MKEHGRKTGRLWQASEPFVVEGQAAFVDRKGAGQDTETTASEEKTIFEACAESDLKALIRFIDEGGVQVSRTGR